MKRALKKAFHMVDLVFQWIEDLGVVISFAAIVLLVFTTVYYRYFLRSGLMWSAEVQEVLVVALAMFGCARAARYDGHTSLGAIVNALPKIPKYIVRTIVLLLSLIFLVAFFFASLQYTLNTGMLRTIMLKIPYRYFYMYMPIGFLLTIYEFIKKIPEKIFKDPPEDY